FHKIIILVSQASEKIWHKVTNIATFKYACYINIGITISKGNVKTVGGIAARIIDRAEAWFVKYRGTDYIKSIESLAGLDDEGSEEPFEVVDVLANVEKDIIRKENIKENVALLAEDDVRKEYILKAWV